MRVIRWTTEAVDQFETAVKYIQQDNPEAARRVARAVFGGIERLTTFHSVGRPSEVKGTRELVVPRYVIVYLLYVWHGAQDWR